MKHAKLHKNVQPGLYGQPFLEHDFSEQIADPLHLAELGIPKTCWKHGILNHASDDARELISQKLEEWKHPLDCKRKDNNRQRQLKWFTGERFRTFCSGERGSPGGPIAIATLLMMVAEDMLINGEQDTAAAKTAAAETAAAQLQGGRAGRSGGRNGGGGGRNGGGGRGGTQRRGRAGFLVRQNARTADAEMAVEAQATATAQVAAAKRQPSAMELACDKSDLDIIRAYYGSRAQARFEGMAWVRHG